MLERGAANDPAAKRTRRNTSPLQRMPPENVNVFVNDDFKGTTLIADQWPWTTNIKSAREGRANAAVWKHFKAWRFSEVTTYAPHVPRNTVTGWCQHMIASKCAYRRYMISEKNYMGLVPAAAQVGDKIRIFRGGQTPFVIRECIGPQQKSHLQGRLYHCIGACYLHGMMDGEAMEGRIGDEKGDTLFYLV